MAIKELVIIEKAEMSGIFDFKAFYSYIYSWFKERQFKVSEKRYMEEVKDNKRSIKIIWIAEKKLSDYFREDIEFEMTVKGMSEIEAEVDGEKKDLNQGAVEVEVKGILVKDFESKWEVRPFSRFMRDIYNKYVIPSRIDTLKEKAAADAIEAKEEAKAFLEFSGKR